jgi:FAD-linked oxidoreductase
MERGSARMPEPVGGRRPTWVNWARTQRCRPRAIHQPDSEAEVADLLGRASAAGETVRAVGAGHSWTDVACTDGHLVSLDRLARVLDIDVQQRRVTVEAGIRIHRLNDALKAAGLGLSILGSVSEQSIAGAIATGTHGSGLRFGNLASQVVAMRLLRPTGEAVDLSPASQPDRFRAARVSLGCLGIVTRLTLRCEPAFNLLERSRPMPFEQALAELDEGVAASEHVKLWWLPHTNRVWWSCYDRTDRPPTRSGVLGRWLDDHVVTPGVFPLLLRLGQAVPAVIPPINRLVSRTRFGAVERVDWAPNVFNVGAVPRHDETEWAIPRERAADALAGLRNLIERERLRVNFIVEVRFSAADDAMLSPGFGRESCHLGAYMFRSPGWDRYFAGFEAMMMERDGRPHWGKAQRFEPDYLRRVYPEMERFDAIRREIDPGGTMENAFIRRVFGGAGAD